MFASSSFFEDDWALAQWKLELIVAKMADLPTLQKFEGGGTKQQTTPQDSQDPQDDRQHFLSHLANVSGTHSASLTTCDAVFYQATAGFYQKKEQLRLTALRSVALFKRMLCPNAPWQVNMSPHAVCAFLKDSPQIFNYRCSNDDDCPAATLPRICHRSCMTGWKYTSQSMPNEYFTVPGEGTCYNPSVSDARTSTYSFDPLSVLLSDGVAGRALSSYVILSDM